MKYIRPSELIHSEEFIREPVHTTLKEIESLPTSKIILRGNGTGRSTVLCYMQDRKANTKNPFIKMNFEPGGISINANQMFTEEFFEHYWEIEFAKRLLWYIKKYYDFADYEKYSELINQSSKETIDFINKSFYMENPPLTKMYSHNEIVEEIIEKFKKQMNIESFWLGVDYFDHINNSDSLTQKIISSYFDLFDKTIITTTDENLPEEWYKIYFKDKSELITYQSYTIDYGKDIAIVQEIIVKRINKFNSSLEEKMKQNNQYFKYFPLEWLNYDTLNLLVTRTNGNIRMMLDILDKFMDHWIVYDYSIEKFNIEKLIEQEENEILEKKLQFKQPKLHL